MDKTMESPVKRKTVIEKVVDDITLQIQQGNLKAGESILSLNQLASYYQVSKSSAEKAVAKLVKMGYIDSIHGKGNFVSRNHGLSPSSGSAHKSGVMQLGLSYPTNKGTVEVLAKARDYALERGALLTTFDVSENRQDPIKEKQFIENLLKAGCRSMGIFATPIAPINSDLFSKLRSEGVKVAVMTPYRYNMSNDVYIDINYNLLGYKAVEKLHDLGVEHIYYSKTKNPPIFINKVEEGVFTACKIKGIDFKPQSVPIRSFHYTEKPTLDELIRRNEHLSEELYKDMPDRSGIICRSVHDAYAAREWYRRSRGENAPKLEIFVLSSELGDTPPVQCWGTDLYREETLIKTIDYLLDDNIPSSFCFQHLIDPSLKEITT